MSTETPSPTTLSPDITLAMRAASIHPELIAAVGLVQQEEALLVAVRATVHAYHRQVIEKGGYRFRAGEEESRPFTFEDYLKGSDFLMDGDDFLRYLEDIHHARKASVLPRALHLPNPTICPLYVAETQKREAVEAMLRVWKRLTGTFDVEDILDQGRGVEVDSIAGVIVGLVTTRPGAQARHRNR